uniref:Uncharacterized protein n=1 Tax=Avena sativa TaxID=4498 RepID=A0ACD5UUH6_AVESA
MHAASSSSTTPTRTRPGRACRSRAPKDEPPSGDDDDGDYESSVLIPNKSSSEPLPTADGGRDSAPFSSIADMVQSKLRVVQCDDEYMTEERQNNTNQDAESSDFNGEEGFTESDDEEDEDNHDDTSDNSQDENTETIKRGRTKLKQTWNLPKGRRIVVKCNDLNQPIGKEAGRLGYFLGTVARNGKLCSLSYTDWRKLIGERDKNTDEQRNKKDILDQVKMRFLYPSRLEKYILKTIGQRWRQHKSNLKSLFFDESKSMEANNTNVPKGVIKDQWISLVTNWMSQKAKNISEKNRQNCTMKKSIHTTGTKSFARNREELRQKDPEKKNPHRAVLYIHTHQHKSDKDKTIINEHVVELKNILSKRPDLADTSSGKTAWKGDALNTILGADKPGHVHGLGLVPNPNQFFGVSSSRHFQDMHLTSLEDTQNEDLLAFRLQLEKVEDHIKNQDAKILELSEKSSERQGSASQISSSRDAPGVAQKNSKRKRVYGDLRSQQFDSVGQRNNVMSKENFLNDMEMQQPNKRPATNKNNKTLAHDQNVQSRKERAIAEKDQGIDLQHNHRLERFEVPSTNTNKETLLHDVNAQPRKESASAEKVSAASYVFFNFAYF